jgi:hypothetical protein
LPPPTWATTLQVAVDTSALSGTPAYLAFNFINYDPASNSVTIADFFTDGTLGGASTTPGVTGTLLPGPVTLTDADFFNEFLQELTLGSTVSFTLTLTQQAPSGSPPDSFAFFLLDATYFPLFETTDPAGTGALFAVDIDGTASGALFNFAPTDTASGVTWTIEPVASVPLPSTAWLIGTGLLGGLAARRRMR